MKTILLVSTLLLFSNLGWGSDLEYHCEQNDLKFYTRSLVECEEAGGVIIGVYNEVTKVESDYYDRGDPRIIKKLNKIIKMLEEQKLPECLQKGAFLNRDPHDSRSITGVFSDSDGDCIVRRQK